MNCRDAPERDAGRDGDAGRDPKRTSVDRGHGERVEIGGSNGQQARYGRVADRDTDDAPDRGENQALGHELSANATRTRAERHADGELAFARGSARDEQMSDVRARDDQQERDGAGKEKE